MKTINLYLEMYWSIIVLIHSVSLLWVDAYVLVYMDSKTSYNNTKFPQGFDKHFEINNTKNNSTSWAMTEQLYQYILSDYFYNFTLTTWITYFVTDENLKIVLNN